MSTINYLYPVAGATPPTSRIVSTFNTVTAQVVMADGDATAVISHNFGSSPTDLAAGFPTVVFNYTTAPTTTLADPIAVLIGTNIVTISKVAQTGSAFTGVVTISRPHTIVR